VALPVDGSDAASVTAAFEALGRQWDGLDGFVDLAGFMIGMKPLRDVDPDAFATVVAGNLGTASWPATRPCRCCTRACRRAW